MHKALVALMGMVMVLLSSTCAFAQFEYLLLQIIQQQQANTTTTSTAPVGGGTSPGYTTDWDSLKPQLVNADVLLSYEQKNFTYDSKAGNNQPKTLTPVQTNAAKGGSCADYSAFTSSVLKADGYQNVHEVSYMWAPGQGHVVTMYLDGGVDKVISNGQYVGYSTDMTSLRAVLAKAVGTDPSKIGNNIHSLPAEWLGDFDNNYVAP